MASAKYEREYGQHLVEQVLKGKMTQAPAAGARVGLRLLDDRRRPAARRLRRRRHRHHGVAERDRRARARHGRHAQVHRPARRSPIPTRSPSTTRAASSSSSQFLEYLIDLNNDNSLQAEARRELDAERHGRRLDLQAARRASRSTTAAPSRPRTWSRAWSASSIPRAAPAPSSQLSGVLSPKRHQGRRRRPRSSSTSTSRSPTSRTWCPSGNYNTAILPRTYKGDIIKNPVGTGPFMLDQYTPKQKATFKKNPTYWGKDDAGSPAAVPGRHRVHHGRGQLGAEPAAAVRRRRPPAADGVPGRAGAVPAIPTCAWTSTRAPASARSRSTPQEPWKAPTASSSARPSPTASTARPSTRPSTTAAATSATTPSGSRPCSPAARRARRRARRTTTRPSSCSPTAGYADGHRRSS